jgi:kynureninase
VSWKNAFSHAVLREGAPLHFAAHSHHPWPDVTFAAHRRYWEDSVRQLDGKWSRALHDARTRAQGHVARLLNVSDSATITFAPNTHEFVLRILSCFDPRRPVRVLTTDSEFLSFARQIARLEEDGLAGVTRVPVRPFEDFEARLVAEARAGAYDLVFVSHVFYNCGFVQQGMTALAEALPAETFLVIDGYHAFMAEPIDLSALEGRVFYMGGGYKYAMSGENAAFLHCPPGYGARPRNTGWFAAFAALDSGGAGGIAYSDDAERFTGATFDYGGLYRFNAVQDWLEDEGLTVEAMADYVRTLQRRFLRRLDEAEGTAITRGELLLEPDGRRVGRFLTFETPRAGVIHDALRARNVITDYRGDRLRLGFGIYHDTDDIVALVEALKAV